MSTSVGALPPGGVAAWKTREQASGVSRVAQAANRLANVAKLAMVVVWLLFSGSWIGPPHPPVSRSTKFGTLPAAILSPRAWPVMAAPSRNWAPVHTEATVVISLMVMFVGGLLPTILISANASLSPVPLSVADLPPVATR